MSRPAHLKGLVGPFPASVAPARRGVYQIADGRLLYPTYAKWDGHEWCACTWDVDHAARDRTKSRRMYKRGAVWYGRPAP